MKRAAKKNDTSAEIIKMLEEQHEHLRDLVDNNELDVYLDGHNIRGDMVDADDDITPEQVAILGAYTATCQALDKAIDLSKGVKKTVAVEPGAMKIDLKTGKVSQIKNGDDLPPEVADLLNKFLNGKKKRDE